MEILELPASLLSIIGALLIVVVLPNVVGQVLLKNFKNIDEKQSYLYPSKNQGIMALGVIFLVIGRFGATLSHNNLNVSSIVYGSFITLLFVWFVLTISVYPLIKKPTQELVKTDTGTKAIQTFKNYPKQRIDGALYSSSVLIMGLIVLLVNHFVLANS